MKQAKTVLVVEPPDESVASKYLLAITRPGNITAGPSLIFVAADGLRRCPDDASSMEALRGEEVVARFPSGLPYLLIERRATRFVSQVAIAKYEKRITDAIKKIYGSEIVDAGELAAILSGRKRRAAGEEAEEDTRPVPGQYV